MSSDAFSHCRPHRLTGRMAAALTFAAIAVPAQAQDAMLRLDALGPPVPDAVLAETRGKFIRPESVSYFGISMVTSWQDAAGVTTQARLVFNVDFLNLPDGANPVPRLMIGWLREGDPAMDVTAPHSGYAALQIDPVGGLDGTSGAVQANIIAGADNSAHNGMQFLVVPTSRLAALDTQGLSPVDTTTIQDLADGDRLEFRLGSNEIGLIMTGNDGLDSTIQSVGGDVGRLLQQTVLNSNGNAVLNNTAVIIGTDIGAGGFDAIRAGEALSVMKGYGF